MKYAILILALALLSCKKDNCGLGTIKVTNWTNTKMLCEVDSTNPVLMNPGTMNGWDVKPGQSKVSYTYTIGTVRYQKTTTVHVGECGTTSVRLTK